MSNYASAGNSVSGKCEPASKVSQVEELLCDQLAYLDRLADTVDLAGRIFATVLHPDLCGESKANGEPQPCRSPLGNVLHSHNERLERALAALDALIRRSAV